MNMAKTVLITGANRGIGLEFTRHYLAQGWKVIATARDVDKAEELKTLSPWKLIQLDTASEPSILAAAKEVEATPIDLLINNAGVYVKRDLAHTTQDDLLLHYTVNTIGPFLMTRALVPNLKLAAQANGDAFVVQMSSRVGSIADNASGSRYGYRASKVALNMLSVNLAMDLKSDNIGVLILHPGHVATGMTNHTGGLGPVEAAANLTKVIAESTLADSGTFKHAEGYTLPW